MDSKNQIKTQVRVGNYVPFQSFFPFFFLSLFLLKITQFVELNAHNRFPSLGGDHFTVRLHQHQCGDSSDIKEFAQIGLLLSLTEGEHLPWHT